MTPSRLPLSLILVASVFIVTGANSLESIIDSLKNGGLFLDINILGLFVGIGLLRLRPGWRTCALIWTWLAIIGYPIVAIIVLFLSERVHISIAGLDLYLPKLPTVLLLLSIIILPLWMYRVLRREDLRNLFEENAMRDVENNFDGYDPIGTSDAQRYVDWYARHGTHAT